MPPSSGLFSGVFSFVSKEFDSFVAGALGSTEAGPSTLPDEIFEDEDQDEFYDEDESYMMDEDYAEEVVRSPPRKRSRRQPHAQALTPETRPVKRDARRDQPSSRREPTQTVPENAILSDDDEGPSGRPPSPPPLPRALRRRASITMPGALFPRSPSMEPDNTRDQHVRFASRLLPSPAVPHSPSSSRGSLEPKRPTHRAVTPSFSPPRRRNLDASVKAAVNRFHEEDADPSILLPSAQTSPHAVTTRVDKGKARAIEPISFDDPEASGVMRVRGKEKELVAAREELDKAERRLENNLEDEASFLEQVKQDRDRDKERIKMLEDEIQRLKQELLRRPTSSFGFPPPPPPPPPPPRNIIPIPRETAETDRLYESARSSLRHAPTPVEKPINPLTTSTRGKPTIGIPPDKMAAFLKEMKTVRLRKVGDRSNSMETSMSSTARSSTSSSDSSLRRTMSLNPPNSFAYPNSSYRPHAGDMSLSELLPRTGDKRKRTITATQSDLPNALRRRAENNNSFGSTTSSTSMSPPLPAATYPPTTRLPDPPSSVTDAPTPSLCSDNDMDREETSPDDQPPTPPANPINISLGPSRAFFRFKGNGIPVEPEKVERLRKKMLIMENSIPPKSLPITSANSSEIPYNRDTTTPAPQQDERSSEPQAGQDSTSTTSVFKNRLPTSPLPKQSTSTRRPRPPARTQAQSNHTQRSIPRQSTPRIPHDQSNESDDEDPLSLSFSSPENDAGASLQTRQGTSRMLPPRGTSPSPHPRRSRDTRKSTSTSSKAKSSRRLTLDEEIRIATSSSPRPDEDHDHELHGDGHENEGEEDNSIYVGVGTRSKRLGFLSGGGAGGVPVFMGVGYIEGVLEDEVDVDINVDVDADETEQNRHVKSGDRERRFQRTSVHELDETVYESSTSNSRRSRSRNLR